MTDGIYGLPNQASKRPDKKYFVTLEFQDFQKIRFQKIFCPGEAAPTYVVTLSLI